MTSTSPMSPTPPTSPSGSTGPTASTASAGPTDSAGPERAGLTSPLRPAWTALRYELPSGDDSRTRAFLWRQLRERGAVNVRHGLWALPHRPDRLPDLAPIIRRLRSASATVELQEVDRHHAGADVLHGELLSACERLWNDFFATSDRLTRSTDGASGTDVLTDSLGELHRTYRDTLARDLALSPAAERAAARLDDLEWVARNVRRAGTGDEGSGEGARSRRPRTTVASSVVLEDGTLRVVAVLDPAPSLGWEHGFEAFVSRPGNRPESAVAVRHGCAVLTGDRPRLLDQLTHLDALVDAHENERRHLAVDGRNPPVALAATVA